MAFFQDLVTRVVEEFSSQKDLKAMNIGSYKHQKGKKVPEMYLREINVPADWLYLAEQAKMMEQGKTKWGKKDYTTQLCWLFADDMYVQNLSCDWYMARFDCWGDHEDDCIEADSD